MAEEKDITPTLNSDDLDVLNLLLHSVRGISQVSGSMLDVVTVDANE